MTFESYPIRLRSARRMGKAMAKLSGCVQVVQSEKTEFMGIEGIRGAMPRQVRHQEQSSYLFFVEEVVKQHARVAHAVVERDKDAARRLPR